MPVTPYLSPPFAATPLARPLAWLTSSPVVSAVTVVTRWPVESQQRARRNAMIASTVLAQRRAELDEIEEFLASLGAEPTREVAAQAATS